MKTVLGIEVKDEVIPGTNIHRPRDRKPDETDDEYVNGYLIGEYYSKFFPQSVEEFQKETDANSKEEENNFFDEEETEELTFKLRPKVKKKTEEVVLNKVKAEEEIKNEVSASWELLQRLKYPIIRKKLILGFQDTIEQILLNATLESKKKLGTIKNQVFDEANSFGI